MSLAVGRFTCCQRRMCVIVTIAERSIILVESDPNTILVSCYRCLLSQYGSWDGRKRHKITHVYVIVDTSANGLKLRMSVCIIVQKGTNSQELHRSDHIPLFSGHKWPKIIYVCLYRLERPQMASSYTITGLYHCSQGTTADLNYTGVNYTGLSISLFRRSHMA